MQLPSLFVRPSSVHQRRRSRLPASVRASGAAVLAALLAAAPAGAEDAAARPAEADRGAAADSAPPASDAVDGTDAAVGAADRAFAAARADALAPSRDLAPRDLDPMALDDLPPPTSLGFKDIAMPLLRTVLMLGVVLGIAYLTLHKGLGKLVERSQSGKRVKVVERTALDPKHSLFIVEVDGQHVLIASGDGGVSHLRDLERPTAAGKATGGDKTVRSMPERFTDLLRRPRSDGGDAPATARAANADERTNA